MAGDQMLTMEEPSFSSLLVNWRVIHPTNQVANQPLELGQPVSGQADIGPGVWDTGLKILRWTNFKDCWRKRFTVSWSYHRLKEDYRMTFSRSINSMDPLLLYHFLMNQLVSEETVDILVTWLDRKFCMKNYCLMKGFFTWSRHASTLGSKTGLDPRSGNSISFGTSSCDSNLSLSYHSNLLGIITFMKIIRRRVVTVTLQVPLNHWWSHLGQANEWIEKKFIQMVEGISCRGVYLGKDSKLLLFLLLSIRDKLLSPHFIRLLSGQSGSNERPGNNKRPQNNSSFNDPSPMGRTNNLTRSFYDHNSFLTNPVLTNYMISKLNQLNSIDNLSIDPFLTKGL